VATSKDNLILDESCKTKPNINYPTNWGFKIIGRDKDKLLACIKKIMEDKEHLCSVGNTSKTGKFTTYNTSCIVKDEEERNKIFKYFEDHSDINMVI
jgi:putative lipoic acid-binding regulatory protein